MKDRSENQRSPFPEDFVWGAATSSYQIEGASAVGGKGPSIWDAFTQIPGKIHQGETGLVSCDHYHRFRDDVALMAEMGLKAYRFSISWPRILPAGAGSVNDEGLWFYSELIDELLRQDITPWVTLYHWDLPLALQLEHDGWINPRMPEFFADYARVCFGAFGNRVRHWITLNEPWVTAILGHGQGLFAPGRVSNEEPYLVAHQLLRAHARAVDVYRREFQADQGGIIGIANNCDWRAPATDAPEDREAAQRSLEFYLGWFADPIYHGDYPVSMRERVGSRLPAFSSEDLDLIHGSSDFFGLNHYTAALVRHSTERSEPPAPFANAGIVEDQDIAFSHDPSWPTTTMGWAVVPEGFHRLLRWIDARYDHPPIIITENGCAADDRLIDGVVNDVDRVAYLEGYLGACREAMAAGVDVRGYFVWSLLDNFEWALGYSQRFGLHYIDYETLERIPKASALWYRDVIARGGLGVDHSIHPPAEFQTPLR
jgi:beta-galactosidase